MGDKIAHNLCLHHVFHHAISECTVHSTKYESLFIK